MIASLRALWPSVIAIGLPMLALEASAGTISVPDGDGTWEVTITPEEGDREAGSLVMIAARQDTEANGAVPEPVEPAPEPAPASEVTPVIAPAVEVDPAAYWFVYRTVPFIRTEYEANPSYRHEATMEFLFGQLRPAVIHKHYDVRRPAPTPRPAFVPPWVYDRYLGQIPTFMLRYRPPSIPFGYPLTY